MHHFQKPYLNGLVQDWKKTEMLSEIHEVLHVYILFIALVCSVHKNNIKLHNGYVNAIIQEYFEPILISEICTVKCRRETKLCDFLKRCPFLFGHNAFTLYRLLTAFTIQAKFTQHLDQERKMIKFSNCHDMYNIVVLHT